MRKDKSYPGSIPCAHDERRSSPLCTFFLVQSCPKTSVSESKPRWGSVRVHDGGRGQVRSHLVGRWINGDGGDETLNHVSVLGFGMAAVRDQ
jgi:hypothetical protein